MEAITRRIINPPVPAPAQKTTVYPWENTNLFVLCQQLYQLAARTGYTGTFEDFKEHFGLYLEMNPNMLNYDIYTGEYDITPLPEVEQILRTGHALLTQDITIGPIPYHEVDNYAGGRTVTIG